MKFIFVLLSFLACFGNSFGQTIRFEVLRESGEPVAGIAVYNGEELLGMTFGRGFLLADVHPADTVTFFGNPELELENYVYIVPQDPPQFVQIIMEAFAPPAMMPAPEEPEPPRGENEVWQVVEESPQFPGGHMAMKSYLAENMTYPERALEEGLQGKVYLKFIVEKDGTITEPVIAKKLAGCPECDEEALRVVRNMPKWTPGKVHGKAVRTYFNLPFIFKLQ